MEPSLFALLVSHNPVHPQLETQSTSLLVKATNSCGQLQAAFQTQHSSLFVLPMHRAALTGPMDEDFEASTMSDGLLDRKPRKRSLNLAVTLEDLFKGGTKKLKVRECKCAVTRMCWAFRKRVTQGVTGHRNCELDCWL